MPKPENFDSLRNDLADTVKLKYRISEEERKLPALFEELGKLAFERFSEGHATDPSVIEKCSEIKCVTDVLEEMQAQLEAIRRGNAEEPAAEEPVAEEPPKPQPSVFDELGDVPVFGKPAPETFCTNCGAKLLAGAAFCLNCGKKVEPVAAEPAPEPEPQPEPIPETEAAVEQEPVPQTEPEPIPEPIPNAEMRPEPEVVQQAPAFCTKCGAKLIPGTMFCTKCGAKAWKPSHEEHAKIPGSLSGMKPDLSSVKPDLSSAKPDLNAIKTGLSDIKPDSPSISIPEVPADIPLQEQINDLADKVPSNFLPDPALTRTTEAPKPTARFCTQCGNKLVGDLPFCPICGHKR